MVSVSTMALCPGNAKTLLKALECLVKARNW